MKIVDITDISLDRLFVEHRLAQRAKKKYYTPGKHEYWRIFEQESLCEIERRADILPINLILDLINSGLTFITRE